jgi:hypothetical protein
MIYRSQPPGGTPPPAPPPGGTPPPGSYPPGTPPGGYAPPPPPPGGYPPQRKGPNWLVIGIIAAVVVAGGATAAVLLLGGDGETPPSPPPVTEDTTGPPTDIVTETPPIDGGGDLSTEEQELLTHVPTDIQASCETSELDFPANASARLLCNDGDVTVYYNQMGSRPEMNEVYAISRRNEGVRTNSGSCADQETAEGTWNVGGVFQGRLLCYPTEDAAWIEWTHNDTSIYSFAFRLDHRFEDLYDWWTTAGPE